MAQGDYENWHNSEDQGKQVGEAQKDGTPLTEGRRKGMTLKSRPRSSISLSHKGQMPSPTTLEAFQFQLTDPAVTEDSQSLIIPNHSAVKWEGCLEWDSQSLSNFYLTDDWHDLFFSSSSFRDRGHLSAQRLLGIILEIDIWSAFYAVQLCKLSSLLYNNPSLSSVEHFGPLWMMDVIWMGSVVITYVS